MTFGCAASTEDPPDATARVAATVHGTGTLFGITSTGIVAQPMDLSANTFATYARSHGETVREVGTGTAEGTFTVPVAAGARTWDLVTNVGGITTVAVGNAREPDVDQYQLGRLDTTLASAGTDVALEVTGLRPWAEGDTTQIVVGNNGAVVFSPETFFATPPANGDNAFTGQIYDWSLQSSALVDAAAGDTAVVAQLVNHTSGTETYQGVERSGVATAFTQTDGAPSTLTATLDAVPVKSLSLHWHGSQFDRFADDVGVGAAAIQGGVLIDALPDAAQLGFYTTSPDLMLYFASTPEADLDVTVSYGNPYANQGTPWDEFAIVQYALVVPVSGTNPAFTTVAGYQGNVALGQLGGGIVEPLISPVRRVTIAGRDARTPQTGVGPSPTVRWHAPTIGHATQYIIDLRQPIDASRSRLVGRFVTKDRELQIPSDFLVSGTTYFMRISAFDFGDVDRTASLFGDGLPAAAFTSVTAAFTP
ncbi:MAG: hypothetical protein HOV81_18550 [Kofleriaceae bacterium]|nr:hypothetical protein [Kofleriaceae bacterium]